jgi:translation initiation factor 4G
LAQRSKEAIAEEMKAKVQKTLEDAKRKKAELEEAERIAKEKKIEDERRAKEEAERLEKERKEEEERKEREEQERLQREKEIAEKEAEEQRLALEKAQAEEEARIAKEKAEEEAAIEAARLAKEKEEAKAKAEAQAAISALTSGEASASSERRPSLSDQKSVPVPLNLKPETPADIITPASAEAFKSASFITRENFLNIKYPEGFLAPDPDINAKFGGTGFHYNVEFLYQFKDVYKEKPSEDWDTKVKETMGDMESRSQRPVGGLGRAVSSSGGFQMGQFGKSSPIARHPGGLPTISTGALGFGGTNFAPRVTPRSMSTTVQGIQAPASPGVRTQSKSQRQGSRRAPPPPPPPPPPPAEPPIEPLPVNPNRWRPQRAEAALGPPLGGEVAVLTPEVVQRKVKSLLNKLTLEKFDKITDQILEIASQSRKETDGRTLRQIIQLTFEKATDEPNFSEMYALFCRKIMETIDPNITDPNVLNKDGQPLTGGQLFRKYLLNRCQEEFERGWKINLPPKPDDDAVGKEAELLSEEYYKAAKAKRQGLGLVQFIGELFKLNMLVEKIMYWISIVLLTAGTSVSYDCSVEQMIRIPNQRRWKACAAC